MGSIVGSLVPQADTEAGAPANACPMPVLWAHGGLSSPDPHPCPTPGRSRVWIQAGRGFTSSPVGPGHTARPGLAGGSRPVACGAARLDAGSARPPPARHTRSLNRRPQQGGGGGVRESDTPTGPFTATVRGELRLEHGSPSASSKPRARGGTLTWPGREEGQHGSGQRGWACGVLRPEEGRRVWKASCGGGGGPLGDPGCTKGMSRCSLKPSVSASGGRSSPCWGNVG